ncbi:MAG: hypothetical protein JWO05_1440 [Gemmatimonadetes bacterium]|nr:hypothetical protein [Gemmatimonadota bacterium]
MTHSSRRILVTLVGGALAAASCTRAASSGTATTTPSPSSAAASTRPPVNPNEHRYAQAESDSAAGEYLVMVGSCNDCHTQGWIDRRGEVPVADRLAGNNVGYRGSWGTVYAANLRNQVSRQSEDRWVQILSTQDGGDGRPPMPWWNMAKMSDRDLRNMYRYIKTLGAKGTGVPRGVPAGREPTTPVITYPPKAP